MKTDSLSGLSAPANLTTVETNVNHQTIMDLVAAYGQACVTDELHDNLMAMNAKTEAYVAVRNAVGQMQHELEESRRRHKACSERYRLAAQRPTVMPFNVAYALGATVGRGFEVVSGNPEDLVSRNPAPHAAAPMVPCPSVVVRLKY